MAFSIEGLPSLKNLDHIGHFPKDDLSRQKQSLERPSALLDGASAFGC
jgi:hypothetical protein